MDLITLNSYGCLFDLLLLLQYLVLLAVNFKSEIKFLWYIFSDKFLKKTVVLF